MKTLICQSCGKSFDVRPYRAAKARYCSIRCRDVAYLGQKPVNTGVYTARVDLVCGHCGKPFTREAGRLQYERGKHCSRACQYAAIKARPSKAKVQRICFGCGTTFEVYQNEIAKKKGGGKYCSRPCRDEHRHGLNHPQYINGGNDDRGPNWQAQRRKALKRDDYTCQHCDMAGQGVHHIQPFRLFGMERYKEANDLANLVTLCEACHRRADAAIQHAERS